MVMVTSVLPCPVCRRCDCPSRQGSDGPCVVPVERRLDADRRHEERRFFPRPEGRRYNAGRRITDDGS